MSLCLALAWGVVAASGAGAELFRCKGADGKVVFTNDKSLCPAAEPFVPQGRVSQPSAEPAAAAPGKATRTRRPPIVQGDAEQIERAEEARWRAKRSEKESELEALVDRREKLRGFVTICNRRGRVVSLDDAGIKHEVPCKEVRRRFAELDAEEARIRTYLDRGLAEECRRAGCLPGWIR